MSMNVFFLSGLKSVKACRHQKNGLQNILPPHYNVAAKKYSRIAKNSVCGCALICVMTADRKTYYTKYIQRPQKYINCSKLGQKVFGHFQVGKCPINVTNDTCGFSVLKECLALFVCRCNFNVYFW